MVYDVTIDDWLLLPGTGTELAVALTSAESRQAHDKALGVMKTKIRQVHHKISVICWPMQMIKYINRYRYDSIQA